MLLFNQFARKIWRIFQKNPTPKKEPTQPKDREVKTEEREVSYPQW